jgi:hypothetical protein
MFSFRKTEPLFRHFYGLSEISKPEHNAYNLISKLEVITWLTNRHLNENYILRQFEVLTYNRLKYGQHKRVKLVDKSCMLTTAIPNI